MEPGRKKVFSVDNKLYIFRSTAKFDRSLVPRRMGMAERAFRLLAVPPPRAPSPITGVLTADANIVPLNPPVVRPSLGAVFDRLRRHDRRAGGERIRPP